MDTYAQYLIRQLRLATSWEEVRDVLIEVVEALDDGLLPSITRENADGN